MSEPTITLPPATARLGLLLPEDEAMARKRSSQRGRIELKRGRWTLRYCIRNLDNKNGWMYRREFLPVGISEKEADAIRVKRMEAVNTINNSLVTQPSMTLEAFSETLWVEYQKQHSLQESTIYSYGSMLKSLVLPSFGKLRMDRITPAHLSRLMKAAREEKYSTKYQLNLFSLLKVLFDVARDYDLIVASPVRAKLHRPVHERTEKRSFTPEQLRALTEHVPEEHRLLCFTAGVLGLRCSELLPLQWGDIQDGMLNLQRKLWRRHMSSKLKTAGSKKPIPLGEVLVGLLEAHREKSAWSRDEDFIFNREGKAYTSDHIREQVIRPAMKAAGIEIVKHESGIHALRHSAGTILYEITRDIELVKRFLRHSRISTTSDIYVHADSSIAAEAVDAMAQVYFGVKEVEGVQ